MAYDLAPQFKSISADSFQRLPNAATGTVGAILNLDHIRALRNRVLAIHKLCDLSNDWDGYGSIAPTTSALAMAIRFIWEMTPDKRHVDQIKPDTEGGVSLIWNDAAARTIFTFDGAEIHMSREMPDGHVELPTPIAYFGSSPAIPPANVLALIPHA